MVTSYNTCTTSRITNTLLTFQIKFDIINVEWGYITDLGLD
jgi:hypothetical protein